MSTNTLTIDRAIENFEFLGSWDERYAYLVELGEALPAMDETLRIDDHRVHACMSKVWVCTTADPSTGDKLNYQGDCDTAIIKGVLALLIGLMSGNSRDDIASMDLDRLFDRLQLAENLSPNRHVGIYAIVELMKEQARSAKHALPPVARSA
jgi:cysteine desulfuration protein SufE